MPRNFDIESSTHFEEFFNLFCGDLLGEGIHRKVFEHRFDQTVVIKCEQSHSTFANVREWKLWDECRDYKPVADWLAPCIDISPMGTILLQRRVVPFSRRDPLPEKIPDWVLDVKPQNWGWLDNRPVVHDYTNMRTTINKKLVVPDWYW